MGTSLPLLNPSAPPASPKPSWLKVRAPGGPRYLRLKGLMREWNLHSVCEEAHCPNIGECWEDLTATFMILGDVCTRNCGYCAVTHGRPQWEDREEPERVGRAVGELGLEHVVITSVNRDDLADGGAAHFAATVGAIRRHAPGCRVELLIPDFQGSGRARARGRRRSRRGRHGRGDARPVRRGRARIRLGGLRPCAPLRSGGPMCSYRTSRCPGRTATL
jgi:lipoic acid synthetase